MYFKKRTKNSGETLALQKRSLSEQFHWQLMIWPAIILVFIFHYIPLYGITIAFKDFKFSQGILGSPWVAFKHFSAFLRDPRLVGVIRNTIYLNVLGFIVGFPAPIILALLLNELRDGPFKRTAQTISYLPHFLSWVIYAGLVIEILRPDGIISQLGQALHLLNGRTNFLAKGPWFPPIFIISSLIKGVGFGSIIYLAALSGVDMEVVEASVVDGANRWHRIRHIMIPAISGTIVILMILAIGSLLNSGIEQLLIFQNPLNIRFSETLDTYVYKIGIGQQRYSYSTAVNLLKSLVSVTLVILANYLSRKITNKGLF